MLILPRRKSGLAVQDVFKANARSGNSSTATVTSGFEPSLFITKSRSTTTPWRWVTTAGTSLDSTSTGAEATEASGVTGFTATGATIGADADYNASGQTFIDYLFAVAPDFCDIVHYTGNGVTDRALPHSLGSAPGAVIIKRKDTTARWLVYHRASGTTNPGDGTLNTDGAWLDTNGQFRSHPDESSVYLSNGAFINGSGGTYVAHVIGHDTSDTGNIQCGSYTGNGSTTGPTVTLGWQPQFVILKRADSTGGWHFADTARTSGFVGNEEYISANSSATGITAYNILDLVTSGFQIKSNFSEVNASGGTFVYIAIRAEGA